MLKRASAAIVFTALIALVAARWASPPTVAREAPPKALGTPGGVTTTRDGLARGIDDLEARWARDGDPTTAVRLADALMRQARVAGNAGLAVRAGVVLQNVLEEAPGHYEALRMMGTVLLSQHRFTEAIAVAERAQKMEPRDTWNAGVIGDASIELGDYHRAFASFDAMMTQRPSPPAYARVSYARELQGDLDGALRAMRMALEATTPHDPESMAWHRAQVGDLLRQMGRLDEADREYRHAAADFPDHPFAVTGQARVKAMRQDYRGALETYTALMNRVPAPDLAARIGELHAALGDRPAADRYVALAENGWRYDTPEPTLLVRLLAAHGRDPERTLVLAEQAAAGRRDIFTMDALAWARFRAGRLDAAAEAMAQALRTGTRDRTLLYHAAAIAHARGDIRRARAWLARALDGSPNFDPIAAPAARALQASLES